MISLQKFLSSGRNHFPKSEKNALAVITDKCLKELRFDASNKVAKTLLTH